MYQHASMNRIYRLVWSESLNAYVAAAETARGRRKSGKRGVIAAALALTAAVAHAGGPGGATTGGPTGSGTTGVHAAVQSGGQIGGPTGGPSGGPTGGQVTGGSATISQSGGTTTIAQSSENLSLNWQSFNIGAQQTVDFVQPNAAAIAVNRILGNSGSVILGHLDANGQVYLINPNGVLFGKGAEVNVGGLVASTLDVSDSTLADASKSFSGSGSGSVINQGSLTATQGGSIALLGNRVGNTGVISAQLGSVVLAAGSAATLRFSGTHLVSMQVDQSVLDSVASNGGLLRADGGQVLMTAGAQKSLLASVVNNTGIIEARTLDNHDGTITLRGGMSAGTVQVAGTLDASAPAGGNGGSIETSAGNVQVAPTAKITTAAAMGLNGSWLIDPTDFTISAGSSAQSASGIGATTLQTELTHGNVAIVTSTTGAQNGDINVNAPVSWSANALTLTAANDINVDAVMTVSGTARVDFEPGSGNLLMGFAPNGSFAGRVDISSSAANALTIGGQVYTVINSLGAAGSTTTTDLQGMNGNLAGFYALGSSVDASATSGWNAGAGFTRIGTSNLSDFSGTFDGLGHTITNLTLSYPAVPDIGLFGWIGATGIVRNVGLVGGSVLGASSVGALAGTNYGTIRNSYAGATVQAIANFAGGLVGANYGSAKISNSYATGNITADVQAGGLVGYNYTDCTVSNSYATGSVSSNQTAGGLVGGNYGTISNSYATGSVSGAGYTGGLVGSNYGTINNSHAIGNVVGVENAGGLVGQNVGAGSISNSYATGSVGGDSYMGGLAGSSVGAITNSYATGNVTATGAFVGGLVGQNKTQAGTVSNSYATGSVSGANYTGGLVGFNTGAIDTSYATGTVNSTGNYVGGLIGQNATTGTVNDSYATGNVSGANYSAGLVGGNLAPATISNSYAVGSVSGGRYTGGLVGWNYGPVSSSFATGVVTGTSNVGGLIGMNGTSGTVTNTYATGSVTGAVDVGGLLGANFGVLTNGYATGSVTASNYGGSLVGGNQGMGTITNSFYNSAVNPTLTGLGADGGNTADAPGSIMGMTSAQLQTQANFTSATAANGGVNPQWDFGATWVMYEGHTDPLLRAFMKPLTVSGTITQTYNAAAFAPTIGNLKYSLVPDDSHLFGTVSVVGSAVGAENVGSYSFTPGGLYSDQLGYLISYNTGTLTITPATLTVSGTTVGSKVYDGNTLATLTGGSLVGLLGGNTLTLTQAGSFASKNAGTGIAVTASDSIGGASAGDYVLVDPTGLVGSITPALLTVSGTTVGNKVYDGSTLALLSGGTLVGLIGGDSVSLNQSGLFASADVGTGIPVTATDTLSGASAGDYSIVEPTGLRGSILPAAGTTAGASDLLLAAINARTQIVENFIYPQLFAQPQLIDASSTIYSADATASQAIVINVSMNIGANGTLKIEQGGLRLPGDTIVGQ